MKIAKSTLKRIIKEELNKLLKEESEPTDAAALIPQEEKDRKFMDYVFHTAYSLGSAENPEYEAIKDAYMEARYSLNIRPLMALHGKNKLFNMIYKQYQEEHGAQL